MTRLLLFLLACGCGETIYAKNYASDCDADTQCVVITVGDVCSCACNLAAINDRDYDKYVSDLESIGACNRNNCVSSDDPDATVVCGGGTGARCSAGTCVTYALPADASAE